MSQPLGGLDKGKCKMPEYEVEVHPDDSDPNLSAPSLDSEFGVPIMRTPRVKKVLTSTNEKLCCSLRAKNSITLYAYNEYMAHHYAFTMKVVVEQEPESPSLRHRLEGGESNYRGKAEPRKAVQRPKKAESRMEIELPHKGRRKPKAAWKSNYHTKAEESRKPHGCRRSRRKSNRTLDTSHLSLRGRVEISSSTRFSYLGNHVTTKLPRSNLVRSVDYKALNKTLYLSRIF